MIETKFKIGDKVYFGNYEVKENSIICPDCLGSKKWKITTPKGEEFDTDCTVCYRGGEVIGIVYDYECSPSVTRLTIGSIQIDTAANEDEKIRYMCVETGVGTGNIYYEKDLFSTEKEALENANHEVKKRQERDDQYYLDRYKRLRKSRHYKPPLREDEVRHIFKIISRLEIKIKELINANI